MPITHYPEVDKLLEEVLKQIKSVFGEKLVGLYLYGSLVWGDFDEKNSDIDLLAVLTDNINEKEFHALKTMHDDFVQRHKEWDDRIEVQYLPEYALKRFKTETSKAAVISPGEPFHIKEISDHWLINWYMVREKGTTLFGPSPKIIIDDISKEEFIESVKNHTRSWSDWVKDMKNRKAQAYTILTLCRALYAIRNGMQPSKKQAALWAKKELPEWSEVIQNAITWRESQSDVENDKENYAKTVAFVSTVRELILK